MAIDLGERLQRLQRLGLHKGTTKLRPSPPPSTGRGIEAAVEGKWVTTHYGDCFVSETHYDLHEKRGGLVLGDCFTLPPEALASCGRDSALADLDLRNAAFIDTETSGLAGGTGTFVFLIGIGTHEDDHFVVRQFFMHSPADEKATLAAVSAALDRCTGMVSYNGKAFDLPLINTRFILNRQLPHLQQAPHLDLLFPTRRLLRARLGSCTLGNVEREALGIYREQADVPGWLIPSLYRDFLRTGDAGEIGRVFYHNLIDIVSLVYLTAYLCRLFAPDRGQATLEQISPIDRFSVGRAYQALGWSEASERAYHLALDGALPSDVRENVLGDLALLLKRQERRDEAARLWRQWTEEATHDPLTPLIELAKHHEWHTRDLPLAKEWTQQALHRLETLPPSPQFSQARSELQHRLGRLQTKIAKDT